MDKKAEEIGLLFKSGKGTPVMPMIYSLLDTAKYSGFALVLYYVGFRKVASILNEKNIVVVTLLSWAVVFGMILIGREDGGILLGGKGMLFFFM